jgi:hypothetical protein
MIYAAHRTSIHDADSRDFLHQFKVIDTGDMV